MKIKLSIASLLVALSTLAQSNVFSEFYVNHNGTNINAGSTESGSPLFTFVSGDWSTTTSGYTAAGQDLSAITVGMWASVYVDGATATPFVGRITNVDNGTKVISVSQSIKSGTAPATGTGTRSIRVGGAWYGPWVTSTLPFGFVQNTMTNTTGYVPRINFKNDAPYVNTNATTVGNAGPIWWSGYSNAPGDGGKMLYMQTQAVAAIDVFAISQPNQSFSDMIISNASPNASYNWDINAAFTTVFRCTSIGSGINGFYVQSPAAGARLVECDAHNCCRSSGFGFNLTGSGTTAVRCLSYSNAFTVAGTDGFRMIGDYCHLINCISAKNGGDGYASISVSTKLSGCDAYSNSASGLRFFATTHQAIFAQNCNFLYNKVAGITNTANQTIGGLILNCGFGTGAATNLLGNVAGNRTGVLELNTINYASGSTPWNDPNNMDFRLISTLAKGTGAGNFPVGINQGFPDVGAVQGNSNIQAPVSASIFGQ